MNETMFPNLSVAIGVDIVRIERVARMLDRWGGRFIQRFLTSSEHAQCRGKVERIAALLAAKEACTKALGTGLRGIGWREVEVLHEPTGKPTLILHKRALERSIKLGWISCSVSLTHDGGLAVATVVALTQGGTS